MRKRRKRFIYQVNFLLSIRHIYWPVCLYTGKTAVLERMNDSRMREKEKRQKKRKRRGREKLKPMPDR